MCKKIKKRGKSRLNAIIFETIMVGAVEKKVENVNDAFLCSVFAPVCKEQETWRFICASEERKQ